MATDAMDIDMDMDPELARYQAEAAQLSALPDDMGREDVEEMNVVEDGEVAGDDIVGNKVYIAGLDELGPQDVQNFASDHYKGRFKIQWINDSAANLVYNTNEAAVEALKAFSAEPSEDLLQERRAVELATHPHVALYVRMSRNIDVKEPGAAERSRYYLLHPEQDPASRPRGRPRRGDLRRGGFEDRRRSSVEENAFDVDLYDDKPEAKAASAKRKLSPRSDDDLFSGRNKTRRISGRGGDLIVDRKGGRLRNRSASPMREGDGRFGFEDDQPYRRTARRRSPPPRPRSHSKQANSAASARFQNELFPHKKTGTPLTNGHVDTKRPVELIPNFSERIELLPDKVNHRRQDAKDLGPDEVATAIGRRPENTRERNGGGKPRDLFDRIKTPAGRLSERPSSEGNDSGFSIRGAGDVQGFSIRGASRDTPQVNDLFPQKVKTDLFAHKMVGRGAQRRTADDDLI